MDKKSLSNLLLLGLFALGLGLSLLVVRSRSAIILSGPVVLPGEGLSVSVPVGTGWNSLSEWKYERNNNSFTLVSAFAVQSSTPSAEVRWQYQLAEQPLPANTYLEQYISRFSGQASELHQFESAIPFYWVYLFPRISEFPQFRKEYILGAAALNNGRLLLLQIRSHEETLYILDLFEQLAASPQILPDPRRESGRELVTALANRDYSVYLETLFDQPSVFLVNTAGGKPFGYIRQAAAETDSEDFSQWVIHYEEVLRGGRSAGKTSSQFQAAENLSEYIWTTARTARRRGSQSILQKNKDGSIEVRDSYGRKETLWPAPEAVPEILLPVLARSLLESGHAEAMIDIISSAGWIVSAALSEMNPAAISHQDEKIKHAIKVDFMHDPENYEEYYFDAELNWLGKYEAFPSQTPRLWQRATEKDLLFYFGDLFDKPAKPVKQFPLEEGLMQLRLKDPFREERIDCG